MLLPVLGYFFCMIAVLTAAAGVMLGLFNTSTSERVHHYPRPVVERNVTDRQPRLFMVVPGATGLPAKDTEDSPTVPIEKIEKSHVEKHRRDIQKPARQRENYGIAYTERSGYRPGLDSQR
jgi:hypothetical protein